MSYLSAHFINARRTLLRVVIAAALAAAALAGLVMVDVEAGAANSHRERPLTQVEVDSALARRLAQSCVKLGLDMEAESRKVITQSVLLEVMSECADEERIARAHQAKTRSEAAAKAQVLVLLALHAFGGGAR